MIDYNLIKIESKLDIEVGKKGNRVGILNRGKNNKFISNTFEGLDVAIDDQGENTLAIDNKVK